MQLGHSGDTVGHSGTQWEFKTVTNHHHPTESPTAGEAERATDTPPPYRMPWFHLSADWRKAFTAWNDHRATCPTCRISERTAATAGTGIKCDEGKRLHTAYESALDSSPT